MYPKNIILLGSTGSIGKSTLKLLRNNRDKFNLIGVPYQIIIGKKSEGDLLEFKETGKDPKNLNIEQITKILTELKEKN